MRQSSKRVAVFLALLTVPACLDFAGLGGGAPDAAVDGSTAFDGGDGASDSATLDAAQDGSCTLFEGVCDGNAVVQLAVSTESACALLKEGVVYCWGFNLFGEVGQVPIAGFLPPTRVPGLDHVTQIAGGDYSMCALRIDPPNQDVYCWGNNEYGQLGHDRATDPEQSPEPGNATPQIVHGLGYVKSLFVGGVACAINTFGATFCWGPDQHGALGRVVDAGFTYVPASPNNLLTTPKDVAVGNNFVCEISSSTIGCWGANDKGQLGHLPGTNGDVSTPYGTANFTPPIDPPNIPQNLTVIGSGSAALTACGATASAVSCWGLNVGAEAGVTTFSHVDTAQIAVGATHTCLRTTSGDVFCWGTGPALGVPEAGSLPQPQGVVFNATDIAAGTNVTLAAAPDGSVWGWGNNNSILWFDGGASDVPHVLQGLP